MLSNILKHHPGSKYTVCDTFCGVQQLDDVAETTHVTSLTRKRFDHNIAAVPGTQHIPLTLYPEFSCNMYCKMFSSSVKPTQEVSAAATASSSSSEMYDVIYIDGSHVARDVLLDAVCAFTLLKPTGILMFDDYQWKLLSKEYNCPGLGIDVFKSCFEHLFQPIHVGYQYHLKKLNDGPLGQAGSRCDLTSASAKEGGSGMVVNSAAVPETVPEWWLQFVSKSLLPLSSAAAPPSTLQPRIMVLGDVQRAMVEHVSEQVCASSGSSSSSSSSSANPPQPSSHLTYCSTNLTPRQQTQVNDAAASFDVRIGLPHVLLSKALVASSYAPVYDVILIGNVGGDASTALLSLCLAFSLLKVGGVLLSFKGNEQANVANIQLAIDGLCGKGLGGGVVLLFNVMLTLLFVIFGMCPDCYEPHVRIVQHKRMNVLYRIDEIVSDSQSSSSSSSGGGDKRKDAFRNH